MPEETPPTLPEQPVNTPSEESPSAAQDQPIDESENLNELGGADEISEKELGVPPETPPKSIQPKKSKKKVFLILLLLVLIGGGAAAWYFLIYKKPAQPVVQQTTETKPAEETKPAAPTYEPNTVVYAYKAKDADPFSLYIRPAAGGDRTEVEKLGDKEIPNTYDVSGSNVAVAIGPSVLVSTDAGKSYTKIFTGVGTAEITSLLFSTDGTRLAIAYLADANGKNVVKSVDLKGKDEKDLFTDSKAGVFLAGWDNKNQQIVYEDGCYNCDGPRSGVYLQDLSKKTTTQLLKGVDIKTLGHIAVSSDFSTLVYQAGSLNAAADKDVTVGNFVGAPYTVGTVNLSSLKESTVATFGDKGEKNKNGTFKTRSVLVGFMAGTSTSYYTDDANLYVAKTDTPSNIYTATKPLLYVPYVSETTVISGAGDATSDYALTSYDVSAKKSTDIFSGDNNTILLGVTTK